MFECVLNQHTGTNRSGLQASHRVAIAVGSANQCESDFGIRSCLTSAFEIGVALVGVTNRGESVPVVSVDSEVEPRPDQSLTIRDAIRVCPANKQNITVVRSLVPTAGRREMEGRIVGEREISHIST